MTSLKKALGDAELNFSSYLITNATKKTKYQHTGSLFTGKKFTIQI